MAMFHGVNRTLSRTSDPSMDVSKPVAEVVVEGEYDRLFYGVLPAFCSFQASLNFFLPLNL